MKRMIFKLFLFLLVVAAAAVVGYAYLGDLSPEQIEIREPVKLDVN